MSTDDLGLTFELPIWNPLSESPQLAQPDDSRLVVVVATGEDRSGLASLMRRVVQRVPFESNTSFVVITPHLRVGVETSGQLITAGCPDDLRLSTIVVEPSGDGIAGQFCRAADLIVAARPQDAMIPAVQGSRSSLLVLAGARPGLGTSFSLPQTEPAEPSVLLVPTDDGLDSAVAIMEANEDTEIFVLHGSSAGPDVARLLTTPPSRFDVAVLGKPHPISGAAELGQLVPDVLVVHRDAVRPLSRWVTDVESLGELTGLVSRSELAHSLRRLVLPAISSSTFEIVEDVRLDAVPEWAGATGPIGRINQEAVRRASDLTHVSRSPRISPNRTDTREIRSWAKEHTWGDRIRLALPWKWGLLPRAMRGRW